MQLPSINKLHVKWAIFVLATISLSVLAISAAIIAAYFHDNDPENPKRHFEIHVIKNPKIKSYTNISIYINGQEQKYLQGNASDTCIILKITSRNGLKPTGKIVSTITSIDSVAYKLNLEFEYGKNRYVVYRIYPMICEGKFEDVTKSKFADISQTIDSLKGELMSLRKITENVKNQNNIIERK